jgi:hypothetical protein
MAALMAGWPTVTVMDANRGNKDSRLWDTGRPLNQIAALAGWSTPMAGTPAQNGNNAAGNNDSSRKTVAVVAWHLLVETSGWPTPTCQSPNLLRGKGQDPVKRKEQGHTVNLTDAINFIELSQPARLTVSGEMLTGSDAGMESGGQLNPAHSRWLMGLPAAWDDCAVTETPSMLSKRESSLSA